MNKIVFPALLFHPIARWAAAASLAFVPAASLSAAGALDAEVLELFESKCAECHEKDMDEPELGKAMNLRDLRQSKFMKPGHPEQSKLFDLVSRPASDKERMPRSRGPQGGEKYKTPLTEAERNLIRDWIAGDSAPAAAAPAAADRQPAAAGGPSRSFISEDEIHALVLKDLKSGGLQDQRSWRYVTLHNYWNQADISDKSLSEFVQAISMLVNSLSTRPKIVCPTSLDDRNVVFRIDSRDYGFGSSLWQSLMRHYPFGLNRGTEIEAEIEKLAGTEPVSRPQASLARREGSTSETLDGDGKEWPVARADWWLFMLSQPPLYYEVLGLPGSSAIASKRGTDKDRLGIDGELERSPLLNVKIDKEALESGRVMRMGFEKSEVSQGHRVVERHPVGTDGRYYWKSFDFNKDRTQVDTLLNPADIFRAPLGPPEYGLTIDPRLRFRHDGGEMIFSLPNGLQGYLLTDGQGKRLDRGPFEVVQDKKHPRGSIIAGVSCMGCHPQGLNSPLKNKVDEIARLAEDLPLKDQDRDKLKTLYGRQAELNVLMQADMDRFASALKACGVTAEQNPVWTLYEQFLFKEIKAENLGAEFSTEKEGIADKLKRSNIPEVRSTASRPSMDRLVFLSIFSAAAEELGLGLTRSFTPIAVAETEAAFKDQGANLGLLTNPLKGASRTGWTPPATGITKPAGVPSASVPKMRRVDNPND